jgi:hypothetical protein
MAQAKDGAGLPATKKTKADFAADFADGADLVFRLSAQSA